MLILPYKGEQDERALRNINMKINCHLPDNKKVQVIYTGTKLGSKFNITSLNAKVTIL